MAKRLNNDLNNTAYLQTGMMSSAEGPTIEKQYLQGQKKNRNKFRRTLLLFLLIQSFLLLFCNSTINEYDLNKRVSREMQMDLTGKISLETGDYTGETDFGFFDGEGKYRFNSGTTYSGDWSNNEIEGVGVLKNPSEGQYKGEFKSSQKHGQGTYTWEDGTVYKGQWSHDQMSGKGKYTDATGFLCDGTFKENRFEDGHCTFDNSTGKYDLTYSAGEIRKAEIIFTDGTTYSGTLTPKSEEGSGVVQYKDGDQYEGEVKSGKRNGTGIYTWASGDTYSGDWDKDAMAGNGKYLFANGNTLEGSFKNNQFQKGKYTAKNDFGTYVFTIDSGKAKKVSIQLTDGTTYEGDISNNKLSGSAQIKYSNGDTYSGSISEGKKSGSGVYTWKNGAKYDGAWENDSMNGKGTYTYPSDQTGLKLEGTFVSGAPNGTCTYYVSSNESYETNWENGKCVKVIE